MSTQESVSRFKEAVARAQSAGQPFSTLVSLTLDDAQKIADALTQATAPAAVPAPTPATGHFDLHSLAVQVDKFIEGLGS